MMRQLPAILGAMGLALTCGCGAPQKASFKHERVGTPTDQEQSCFQDRDCVLVEDCCGCAQGGTQLAVHRGQLGAATARADQECQDRVCGGGPPHRSCQATAARCLGGVCVPAL